VWLLSTVATIVDLACTRHVIMDNQLSLDAHVAALCRSSYCQLRQLRPVVRSLSADAAKTLVHGFVSSQLDYCNALLYGMSEGLLHRIQFVKNAAVRLVTGMRHRDIITPILRQLHWLPVWQEVQFKVAVLVFQCLSGSAPMFLAASTCADPARLTRRHNTQHLQRSVFATAGPRL